MRRFLCALAVLLLLPHGRAGQPQLNLFIWSEYIDPAVVAAFEKQFACKVNIDVYEDAESMLAKVQGGGVSLYDIVVPPDHIVRPMVKLGLLAPLRHTNLPNLNNLDAQFASPPYDPGNKYTVAYQWGTVGLFARQANGKPLTNTWGLVFDPKLQPGPFVLIDSMRDLIGAALKYKGFSLNSTNIAELKVARDLVIEARKRAVAFDGSVGTRNKVLSKVARVGMVYSGEGVRGVVEDKKTVYFIPQEGSQIWVDNLAILAKAPHRDLAEKFINYILEGRVAAQLSSFTQYASPNRAALPFLKPEDLANLSIYPSKEVRAKLEFLEDLGAKTRLYDEIWTQIKAR